MTVQFRYKENKLSTTILFFFFLTSLIPFSSFAETENTDTEELAVTEDTQEKEPARVDWYAPELIDSKSDEKSVVLLSGFITRPKTKVSIAEDGLLYTPEEGDPSRISRSDVYPSESSISVDERGYFEFELSTNSGSYQIPLQFEIEDEAPFEVRLSFDITAKEVKIDGDTKGRSLRYSKNNQIWVGGGINYLSYQQKSAQVSSDVTFSSFQGPTLFAEYLREINDKWRFNFSAEYSPGEASQGDNIAVPDGDYAWTIFVAQGSYKFWQGSGYFGLGELRAVLGLQYHEVPFISRESFSEVSIKSNSLSMTALGLHYSEQLNLKWDFISFLRYQYPLATGSEFTINPTFAFDGSLGLSRILSPQSRIGLYWFGQWHNYSYETQDIVTNGLVTGEQDLFFSKFEIRYGLFF